MNERVGFIKSQVNWLIYNKVNFYAIKDSINDRFKKYSYLDFKTNMNTICNLVFKISYVCCSLLQFFATWAGLVKIFHNDNIILQLASFVLGFLPLIGTISGLYGAHIGWGWSLSYSLFVFIAPYLIVNSPMFLIAFFEIYKDVKRWKIKKKQKGFTV